MASRRLWLFVLAATCVACGGPAAVRRTALIPAAYLPARTGEPLDALQVRIQGEANPVRLSDGNDPVATEIHDTVRLGDPGLLIPQAHVGAAVYFAPARFFEFGGHFRWASYKWSRANKAGVLDLPVGRRENAWQGGLGMRFNIRASRIDLTLSPILQIDFVEVPEAEYVNPAILYPGQGYEYGFRFSRMYHSTWVYPAFFFQIDQGFLDSTLHVHLLWGIERALENVGFDWGVSDRSTVRSAAAMPIGIGIEYRVRFWTIGATFFYPIALGLELERGTFGPALALRTGFQFGGRRRSEARPATTGPADEPGVETMPPPGGSTPEDAR